MYLLLDLAKAHLAPRNRRKSPHISLQKGLCSKDTYLVEYTEKQGKIKAGFRSRLGFIWHPLLHKIPDCHTSFTTKVSGFPFLFLCNLAPSVQSLALRPRILASSGYLLEMQNPSPTKPGSAF
jgi:hypothetical protein